MKKRRDIPTVGGQPARMLYGIIEASPKSELADGTVHLELRLCQEHGRLWQQAAERVERQVMAELASCETPHDHRPLLPYEWRALVIHAMADECRRVLGIVTPHPHWC